MHLSDTENGVREVCNEVAQKWQETGRLSIPDTQIMDILNKPTVCAVEVQLTPTELFMLQHLNPSIAEAVCNEYSKSQFESVRAAAHLCMLFMLAYLEELPKRL